MTASSARSGTPGRLVRIGAFFLTVTVIAFGAMIVADVTGLRAGDRSVRAVLPGEPVPVAGNLFVPEKSTDLGETASPPPTASPVTAPDAASSAATETQAKKQSTEPDKAATTAAKPDKDFEKYLDRLMIAESGGRNTAKNPRSTALGPYQFIESTFLHVTRRYLPGDIEGLSRSQILALRTNRKIARKAAAAYNHENAAHLTANGVAASYPNLRLAFLLGPQGALNVIKADPKMPLTSLMSPAVLRANPFMYAMSAGELTSRAAREISLDPGARLTADPRYKGQKIKTGPRIAVKCNLGRPSCRRWLAMKRKSLKFKASRQKTAGATSR